MNFENTLAFAQQLDMDDPLSSFKEKFHFPSIGGKQAIYFCGNSLGLQPKSVLPAIKTELEDWASLAVEGHTNAINPWVSYHKLLTKTTAKLVGAKPIEVSTMNSLTVNLNSLFISFYRPTKKRFKIITEYNPFSSDSYLLETQAKLHGLNPKKTIIEVKPRKNELTTRTEDILDAIKKNSKELALVFLGGVHYYTGQAFDIKEITKAAHKAGAIAGFDLAHAAGNIELKLNKWEVDFASWCTYKYLNAGPGAVGQLFVHEKHAYSKDLPRLSGWWGHDEKERFLMKKGFNPMPGAEGWAQSNDNVLSMASLKASLEVFEEAGNNRLFKKSQLLTGYLEYLLKTECKAENNKTTYHIQIITPSSPKERGAQLSIYVKENAKKLYDKIRQENFIVDYRNPDVIRITPVPLYNSFEEIYLLVQFLKTCCRYQS
jgi:kynureninase